MNPAEFSRSLARIKQRRGRNAAWRKRATRHLLAEAGAVPVERDGRLLGYRLPRSNFVCVWARYKHRDAANDALWEIERMPGSLVKPVRAFQCDFCFGFHLTAKA